MSARFNKPPGWPQPPAGWKPAPDWVPDPKWPTPPPGWQLWSADAGPQWPTSPLPTLPPLPPLPAPPSPPVTRSPAPPVDPAPPEPELLPTLLPWGGPITPTIPAAPVASSVKTAVFGLGGRVQPTTAPSRPTPKMIGWGSLGVVLLAAAGFTVGGLAVPPSTSVDSAQAAAAQDATPATAAPLDLMDSIEQAITHAEPGTPLAGLADLKVRPRGPSTDFAQSEFGSALRDTDGNGCDQRNDVLRRDLTRKTLKAGSHGCTVLTGTLRDPYTGRSIRYQRTRAAVRVRIDHVVPLGDAWVKGARTWSAAKRAEFTADPLNLLAVGATATAGKGAADATRWLPEATGYRCAYVARQIVVKRKYGMWVSLAERTAIGQVLTGCPNATRRS